MSAGSALIFDDRILHRGGHNASSENRDVVFFSYSRPDFKPATHYEAALIKLVRTDAVIWRIKGCNTRDVIMFIQSCMQQRKDL